MTRRLLPLTAVLLTALTVSAAEPDDKFAAQKKAAENHWGTLDIDGGSRLETDHFLVYAPKSLEGRLKDASAAMEKTLAAASKVLKVDPEKDVWPGKLTVYLLPERAQFTAFVRRIEKRRLEDDEFGTFVIDGDLPHVAASPGKTMTDPSVEAQAAQQVAAAVLQRKTGAKVPLPGWLLDGFGRATFYRAAPAAAMADRKVVLKAMNAGRKGKDVWDDGVTGAEILPLRASVAEYLAYGPGTAQFTSLMSGFRPDEGQDRKETSAAFAAAEIKPDELDKAWWAWALKQR